MYSHLLLSLVSIGVFQLSFFLFLTHKSTWQDTTEKCLNRCVDGISEDTRKEERKSEGEREGEERTMFINMKFYEDNFRIEERGVERTNSQKWVKRWDSSIGFGWECLFDLEILSLFSLSCSLPASARFSRFNYEAFIINKFCQQQTDWNYLSATPSLPLSPCLYFLVSVLFWE